MTGQTLHDRFEQLRAPGEAAARARAAHAVETAFAQPRVDRHRQARRGRPPWRVLAVALGAVLLAGGASAVAGAGPGRAVSDWVREVVGSPRSGPLGTLPGGGRLLVAGAGSAWLVAADGDRHRLGAATEAVWSPHGMFVAVAHGRQLAAVEPGGAVHWTLGARGAVQAPLWSPDGYRIAYRTGTDLRVVAGDGSGDRSVRRGVARVAAAWRPDRTHALAYVTQGGRLVLESTDSGRRRLLDSGVVAPARIAWAGRRLLLLSSPTGILGMHVPTGHGAADRLRTWRAPADALVSDVAVSPSGNRIAVLLQYGATSEIRLLDPRTLSVNRTIATVRGRAEGLVWSPDGSRVLTALPGRGLWMLAAVARDIRAQALTGIGAAFGSGSAAVRPVGWSR